MHQFPPSDDVLATTLAEDLGVAVERIAEPSLAGPGLLDRDVTTAATVPAGEIFSGRIVARQDGVVCGLPAVARIFELLARACGEEPPECFPLVPEGADVRAGTAVLEIEGPARLVLAGERSALNFVMVLSGIASEARRWQKAAGDRLAVTDTRKTLPGLRELSKYAVRVGGAHNHRSGLYDMVLIKDNHLVHAGGVAAAIAAARRVSPELAIECEADSLSQAVDAARAGADCILLDNMDDPTLAEAVAAVRDSVAGGEPVPVLESSGGIVFDRLASLAATGVDRVSTSALGFARPRDFALDAD